MAEYQSIFTGQQVDNALSKLRDWINADGSYPTVTVDGITYAVVWKVLPTSSNQVYGIGLHPTTGRVYQIYNNKGVYSATALDFYVDTKNTAGSSNSNSKLFIIGAAEQSANPQTYSHINAYIGTDHKLYSNNEVVVTTSDARLSDTRTPKAHASSATTYGVGTTANYGHVKLATGDMNGASNTDGVAVSKNHTHSQYLLAANYVDTKNTAGSSDAANKLFLIGAASQAVNQQTYSNSKVYTQNGKLYSNNTEVSVVGHTHSFDTITSRGEAFLSWGGKNFSGSYGPIDAAMVPELGANRLAFMPADAVTIEYSRDGGSTWTDYGPTDSQKIDLFNGRGSSFTIGKATSGEGNIATNKYQLRVNIYTSAGRVYTVLNKFVIYLSTSGTNNNWCTIRARKQSDYTADKDTWTTFADKISVSGWSGYNVINTSGITTYGNTASTQYGHIQFIFGCDKGSTNNSYPGLQINKIFGFGGVGWTTPSTMAKTGHMYTYDSSQNVTFPAGVSAKSFTENGKTLSATYIAKSVLTTKGDMIYASGTSTPTRLGIGSNGQFLSVADGIPKWVNNPNTDTDKKTASSNNDAKLFLIGAAVQSADGQTTYSNSKVYTQNGILYSDSKAVLTGHATHIVTINSGKKSDDSTDISSNSGTATSGNMTVTLGDSGVAAGTYRSVTVNSKGIVVAGDQTDTDYDTKNTAGSTNSTSTLYLVGASVQAANPQTYSNSKVYMTDGTLYLTKDTDLSGTVNYKPALIVGGTDTTAHLEADTNEIQAKASGTTTAPLYLNHEGGNTYLSGEKTYSDGTYLYSNSKKVSIEGHTHSQYLTAHPTITKETDTTSTASPAHGETFTVIDSITRETNGHVTKINTKTVTLPGDNDTKNTAGSSNSASKLFLIGTGSQSASGVTSYSNSAVYSTAGQLDAAKFRVAEKVTMQYNSTEDCIEFIFA